MLHMGKKIFPLKFDTCRLVFNCLFFHLAEEDLTSIMVVDFGNALRNTEEELSLYYSDFELQTLLYRAPEVIFGLRFGLEVS